LVFGFKIILEKNFRNNLVIKNKVFTFAPAFKTKANEQEEFFE